MKDYVYPKVPNHYHESVPNAFFDADDLSLLEKFDGSNCKVCMYDERYHELYGDDIHDWDPQDGDIFISSKTTIRGRLSDPIEKIDDAFNRLVTELREQLNVDVLRDFHNEYDSPLLLFGEHMIHHSLDYGYDQSPPPAFIGFDILELTNHSTPPPNPFDERFTGFLPLDDSKTIFEAIGMEMAPVISKSLSPIEHPESIDIPDSEYGDVQSEGVIFRSDSRDRRVKYVSEDFRERTKKYWGMNESDAESGAELFAARYLTNARLQKTVNKQLYRSDTTYIDPQSTAAIAIADAWEEELTDIRNIRIPITPHDVFPIATQRAEAVLETMKTNADLNNSSIGSLWSEHQADTINDLNTFDTTTSQIQHIESRINTGNTTSEESLVRAFITEQDIHKTAEDHADATNKDLDRWVITPTVDSLEEKLWFENLDTIAQLSISFTPVEIQEAVLKFVMETIEKRDDVTIDEKPDDWAQNINDADPSGLGDLF